MTDENKKRNLQSRICHEESTENTGVILPVGIQRGCSLEVWYRAEISSGLKTGVINWILVYEMRAPCPFLYCCLQNNMNLNSYPQVIKRGLFIQRTDGSSGENWSIGCVIELQSKALFILTYKERGSQLFCGKKEGDVRKRKIWDKEHGVPNPEVSGDDNQVDTLLKEWHRVSEEMSLWKKTERRIPWNNY